MTTKLYQQDVYIRDWTCKITSAAPSEGDSIYELTLDQTAFFPEGGGQSCDIGSIGEYQVIDVQEDKKRGEVLHTIKLTEGQDAPESGSTYQCSLDWDRRFDNMQRHCGEHIMSGIFYDLYGGVNRGFHMGEQYMTIDISLEEKPEITEIDFDMAIKAETKANEVIWSNAPVTVMHFEDRAEAEKLPLRKALAFDEDISIVCVGSVDNAADCVACCGTHPSTAGQVGLIKVYKVEKYKNMFRIYLDAGRRALEDYDRKHEILMNLSNRYSSSIEEFPDKIMAQEHKIQELKNDLFHIKNAYIDIQKEALDAIHQKALEGSPNGTVVTVYPLENLSIDDAFQMAKSYMGKCQGLIMLYSVVSTSYVLVSGGDIDCGNLVKEYASFYKGKGGGNNLSARAIFSNDEDAQLFAQLITNHLK